MERTEMKLLGVETDDKGNADVLTVSLMPSELPIKVALPLRETCPDSERFSCILKGLAFDDVYVRQEGAEEIIPDREECFSIIFGKILKWDREAGNEHVLRLEVRSMGVDIDLFVDESYLAESDIRIGAYLRASVFQYVDFGDRIETE